METIQVTHAATDLILDYRSADVLTSQKASICDAMLQVHNSEAPAKAAAHIYAVLLDYAELINALATKE